MKRVILTPPVLPPAALAELKQWLGITTARDDAPLGALLAAALSLCEAFTGVLPLECSCEETLPAGGGWQRLSARPVLALTGLDGIDAAGQRTALPAQAYAVELDGEGGALIRVLAPGAATRVAVRFTAGLASDWDDLPDGLRHGLIRLAAHQHRQREGDAGEIVPHAAVAALWRPWRRLRLV